MRFSHDANHGTGRSPGSDEERAARALHRCRRRSAARRGRRGPPGFAALLFGRAAPEDLVGYQRGRARRRWRATPARSWRRASPARRKSASSRRRRTAGERLKTVSVIEIVNDDMPFLVDSVMGELTERGLDGPAGRASDPGGRARRATASSTAPPARGARPRRASCARASSTSTSTGSTTPTGAPRSCRRWSRCWPRSGSACRTGGRCSAASAR